MLKVGESSITLTEDFIKTLVNAGEIEIEIEIKAKDKLKISSETESIDIEALNNNLNMKSLNFLLQGYTSGEVKTNLFLQILAGLQADLKSMIVKINS